MGQPGPTGSNAGTAGALKAILETSQIIERIQSALPQADVVAEGSGCNFSVRIRCPSFVGQSRVARQQKIYKLFSDELASGALHSLSITAEPMEGADV